MRKYLVIGQYVFFSAFHWLPSIGKPSITSSRLRNHTKFRWSPSIGKPRMTPVSTESYDKTTESHEVRRLGDDMGGTFTGTGRITASDQTVRAVLSKIAGYVAYSHN